MVDLRSTDPVDVLIFSPHPDDEVIGCGGAIQHALAAGKRVRVVFTTSGDGYPRAASALFGMPQAALTSEDFKRLGRTREREAIAADHELGLAESDLVFLRYPDAGMHKISASERLRAIGDFCDALRATSPSSVYVTDAADDHADHRVTNELALAAVAATGYTGDLFTFVVHTGGDVHWPLPGPVFESNTVDRITYPTGINWPPPIRVKLTDAESVVKLEALKKHASQWAIDHAYLGLFVKSEEIFWRT